MASPFELPPTQPPDEPPEPPDIAAEKPAGKKIENFDELGVEIGGSFLSNKEKGTVLDIQPTDEHDGGGYVQVELIRNDTNEPTRGKMTFATFMEYANNGTIEKIEPPPEAPEPTPESSAAVSAEPQPESPESSAAAETPEQKSPESATAQQAPQFSQETAQPESDERFYSQSTGAEEARRASGSPSVEHLVREQLAEKFETVKQQLNTPDFALRKQRLEGLINSNKQSNEHVAIEHVRQGRMTEASFDGWLQQRLGPYFNQNLFSGDTKEDRRIQRYLSSFSNEIVHAQSTKGDIDNLVESKLAGLKARQELLGPIKGLLAPMVSRWQNEFFEKRHTIAGRLVELGGERRDAGLGHLGQQLELMNLQGMEQYAPTEKSLDSNYKGAVNFGRDVWKATKFVAPRIWEGTKFTARHGLTAGKLFGKGLLLAARAPFYALAAPFYAIRHPIRTLNRIGHYATFGALEDPILAERRQEQERATAAREAGRRQEALLAQARQSEEVKQRQENEKREQEMEQTRLNVEMQRVKIDQERQRLEQQRLSTEAFKAKQAREQEKLEQERNDRQRAQTGAPPNRGAAKPTARTSPKRPGRRPNIPGGAPRPTPPTP